METREQDWFFKVLEDDHAEIEKAAVKKMTLAAHETISGLFLAALSAGVSLREIVFAVAKAGVKGGREAAMNALRTLTAEIPEEPPENAA